MAKPIDTKLNVPGYLNVHYGGYFMCRIATDPDPTNERSGRSGYTLALPGEEPLDQAIRLQFDNSPGKLREPAGEMNGKTYPTVKVTGADIGGVSVQGLELLNASVNLLPDDDYPLPGPIFESRNNIVGSDNTMAFVVNPFHLVMTDCDQQPLIDVVAVVNPANPEEKIWQVSDPAIYRVRLPVSASYNGDNEVNQATGVYDYDEYFRARRLWLSEQIELCRFEMILIEILKNNDFARARALVSEKLNVPGYAPSHLELIRALRLNHAEEGEALVARIIGNQEGFLDALLEQININQEKYKTRLYTLDFWGSRVVTKMGYKVSWDHFVSGNAGASRCQSFSHDGKRFRIDFDQPWRIAYWFGGWDGDLLLGYHKGTLSIPVFPE